MSPDEAASNGTTREAISGVEVNGLAVEMG